MASNIFRTKKIYSEISTAINNQNKEIPIIDKYYTELRAKIKPDVEPSKIVDENQIRRILIQELSPILKDQTTNFIERLAKTNDLNSFYKFSKLFLSGTKDIREIDSSFMFKLWEKFKSKMIIEPIQATEASPIITPIDAPYGTTASLEPRAKPGRKTKEEKQKKEQERIKAGKASLTETLEKSSLFLRQREKEQQKEQQGKPIGTGIVGRTYIGRR